MLCFHFKFLRIEGKKLPTDNHLEILWVHMIRYLLKSHYNGAELVCLKIVAIMKVTLKKIF